MNLVKIKNKYQVTIPGDLRKKQHFEVGELLSVTLRGNEIVYKPVAIEEKYSKEELDTLERLFKSSHNRGKIMSADTFKKYQQVLGRKKNGEIK